MKVVLVGLGNMGLGYDFKSITSQAQAETAMSHLGSLISAKEVEIAALVDVKEPPQLKRLGLSSKFVPWESFHNVRMSIDLLIVSTPTDTHLQAVTDIVQNHNVTSALIEKPVGSNEDEAIKIAALLSKENVAWLANYHRSLFPSFRSAMEIVKKQGGALLKAEIFGWGQLRNIHSHFFHLLGNLCGFSMLEQVRWSVAEGGILGTHESGSVIMVYGLNQEQTSGRILSAEFEHLSFLCEGNGETFKIRFRDNSQEPLVFNEPECQPRPQSVVLQQILGSNQSEMKDMQKGVVEVHRCITNLEKVLSSSLENGMTMAWSKGPISIKSR